MQSSLPQHHRIGHDTIKHVLLVDDSPDDIALTRRALARAGFAVHLEVLQHRNAILQRINADDVPSHTRPDLILVDLNMSKVDGFELIQTIRGHKATLHTPIVVISTTSQQADILQSYECGASSFIHRAVDFTDYAQTLREVCAYWLSLNISPTMPLEIAG